MERDIVGMVGLRWGRLLGAFRDALDSVVESINQKQCVLTAIKGAFSVMITLLATGLYSRIGSAVFLVGEYCNELLVVWRRFDGQ